MKYVFVLCCELNYIKCPKHFISCSHLLRSLIITHKVKNLSADNVLLSFIENNEKDIETIDLRIINEEMFRIYMKQYENENTFYNYFQNKAITKLLICNKEQLTLKNISMLKHCSETEFWQLEFNCLLNENKRYHKRNITDNTYCSISKEESIKINNMNFINDYFSYFDKWSKDINVETSSYFTFRKTEISKDMVNEIICNNKVCKKEQYYLIMSLMVSKSHCHLIVNNKDILQYLYDCKYYNKHYHAFRYALSYAWVSFYKEEQYKWRKMDITDECVFDIHTASLLPYMPTNYISETHGPSKAVSPYLPILLNSHLKNLKTINGIHKKLQLNYNYGVSSMETFQERMNLFVTGQNINLFENINWSNIGITGSIIACCLPNYNPLSHNVNHDYAKFAKLYYANSDIDIACIGTMEDCYDTMLKLKQTLITNIEKHKLQLSIFNETEQNLTEYIYEEKCTTQNSCDEENDDDDYIVQPSNHIIYHKLQLNTNTDVVQIYPEKITNIYINKQFIIKHLIKFKENEERTEELINSKVDDLCNDIYNINHNDEHIVRDYLYDIYMEHHNKEHIFNKKYILQSIPTKKKNIRILYSNKDNELYCADTIKYKFVSIYFRTPLDLFKIKTKTIMGTVSQFHFPCVRAYYVGDNVHMTSSCIGACHTMICNDYKFFANTNNPIVVWLKYLKRGFSFTFNINECKKFTEFMEYNKKFVNDLGFHEKPKYYLSWLNMKTNLFNYDQACEIPQDITYEKKIKQLYNAEVNNTFIKYIIDKHGNIIPLNIDYFSYLLLQK